MTIDNETIDAEYWAPQEAGKPRIRADWTPEQARALGERLARYKRNRQRAEGAYYAERRRLG